MTTCRIIEYKDEHHQAFKKLNAEWLERYNLMESHDLEILNDPRGTIITSGGVIYLAECDGEIVGSAALMREHGSVYELVKMAVATAHQGRGISRLLLDKCLEGARTLGAAKIVLFSNHQLKTALSLYEKYGFQHIPVVDSPFETADVKMELVL